jgi:hypothetical protein
VPGVAGLKKVANSVLLVCLFVACSGLLGRVWLMLMRLSGYWLSYRALGKGLAVAGGAVLGVPSLSGLVRRLL